MAMTPIDLITEEMLTNFNNKVIEAEFTAEGLKVAFTNMLHRKVRMDLYARDIHFGTTITINNDDGTPQFNGTFEKLEIGYSKFPIHIGVKVPKRKTLRWIEIRSPADVEIIISK